MTDALEPYLSPTWFVNSDAPAIVDLAEEVAGGVSDDVERACRLFYAVRDGIRYTAYELDISRPGLRATRVLETGTGWCVSKSVLLAALCRAARIPCRLGYANVRNHMATAKLIEFLGTDVFYYHGYNELYLRDKWVKATTAFNRTLCARRESRRWISMGCTIPSITPSIWKVIAIWNTCTTMVVRPTYPSRHSWQSSKKCTRGSVAVPRHPCRATSRPRSRPNPPSRSAAARPNNRANRTEARDCRICN